MIILKKIINLILAWYWKIPISLGVVAFIGYFILIYLIYGTLQITEIKNLFNNSEYGMFFGFFVPFAIPMFLSLGSTFGFLNSNTLDQAIKYRNGQMSISSDKKAAEIFEKTSHLDIMQNNKDISIFNSAIRGFDAKYGASSPTRVYEDIMKK